MDGGTPGVNVRRESQEVHLLEQELSELSRCNCLERFHIAPITKIGGCIVVRGLKN